MTMKEFVALCEQHTIDPRIALENENLVEALEARDDDEVKRILKEEF